jgi:hypothetical protein
MTSGFDARLAESLGGLRKDGVYKKLNHLDSPQSPRSLNSRMKRLSTREGPRED